MKGTKEQPLGVTIFLTLLFLTGGICVFWIVMEACEKGVVETIAGKNGPTRLNRESSPEIFWMYVSIYALAGLGCLGGFVSQARNAFKKLRMSA
jgi:hypothetical protein